TWATVPGAERIIPRSSTGQDAPSTGMNVASVHRMRDVNVDTHQRRSRLRRVLSRPVDGSHRLGTFLTAKRACVGRGRTAKLGSPDRGGAYGEHDQRDRVPCTPRRRVSDGCSRTSRPPSRSSRAAVPATSVEPPPY